MGDGRLVGKGLHHTSLHTPCAAHMLKLSIFLCFSFCSQHFCAPLLEPMKSMFLSVLFLGLPFANGLAFQHSAALRVSEVSRARCVETPESCADGIDEMIGTATIIKEEVREERTSQVQYTLESGEFLRFEIQAKTENHKSCKVRQKADHDASKSCNTLLTAVKAN